jgi:hypothetical protein
LAIGGSLFALGGVMAILKPVPFYLLGGSRGQWKDAAASGSQGFGWFFLALSGFLFASAWRLARR